MANLGTVGTVAIEKDVAGTGPLKVSRVNFVGDAAYQSGGSLGFLAALCALWKEDRTIVAVNATGENGDNGLVYTPEGNPFVVTGVASTDVFTTVGAHGFAAGDPVVFTASNQGDADLPDPFLPGGLGAGTVYYVIASGLTSTAFKVSASAGGSTIDFTAVAGAGTMLVKRADTLKIITPSTGAEVSGDQSSHTFRAIVFSN